MSRFDLLPNLAVDDPVDETYFDGVTKLIDYFGIAGATLVSGGSIAVTSRYHVVSGTTTIDSITDAEGAVAGQPVDLFFQSALTVRNNGGGTGNIRTLSGGDRIVRANELVSFIFDGTVWRERNTLPGAELSYVEFTAAATISATSEGTANTVVTAAALTFDGSTIIEIEFFVPQISTGTDGAECHLILFDGSTPIGEITDWQRGSSGGSMYTSIFAKRRLTPSAASHTYSVRGWRATANITLTAGAGGSGVKVPGYIKVRRLS